MNSTTKESQLMQKAVITKNDLAKSKLARVKSALFALCLTFGVGSSALADDIEIYTGITDEGTGNERVFKPNILFLLDTSGSMAFAEPDMENLSLYRAGADYGPGGRPNNRVYIYNDDGSYTGVNLPTDENSCKESFANVNDLSSNEPFYRDKLLIWQYNEEDQGEDPPTYCDAIDEPVVVSSQIGSTSWQQIRTFSINQNLDYSLQITMNPEVGNIRYDDVRFYALFLDRFNNWLGRTEGFYSNTNDLICYLSPGNVLKAGETQTCDASVPPPNATKIRLVMRRVSDSGGNQFSSPFTATLTASDRLDSCAPPGVVNADGDWVHTPDTSKENSDGDEFFSFNGVECAADFGDHGEFNGNANKKWPRYRNGATRKAYDEPLWKNQESGNNLVNWESDAITNKYIYSENYHQFLLSPVQDQINKAIQEDERETGERSELRDLNPQPIGDDVTPEEWCSDDDQPPFFNSSRIEGDRDFRGRILANENTVYETYSMRNGAAGIDQFGNLFTCVARMTTLKQTMDRLLTNMQSVNVGIARFNEEEGGAIVAAVQDIDEGELDANGNRLAGVVGPNRQSLKSTVEDLVADGGTPIQESLYTSYLYFAGKTTEHIDESKSIPYEAPADLGISPSDPEFSFHRVREDDVTDPNAYTKTSAGEPDKFASPIENACQDNSIILLSDGRASGDQSWVNQINSLNNGAEPLNNNETCSSSNSGDCIDDLARFMANNDVNTDVAGTSNVFTYTINFGSDVIGSTQLADAGEAGARSPTAKHNFDATTARELENAFDTILKSIGVVSADAFVSPAVAVNAFNRLQFREELYFAVFEPEDGLPRWNGNVKKYRINSNGQIIDREGNVAVGPTGFFTDQAKSEWISPRLVVTDDNGTITNLPDGPNVRQGGAADQLTANRNLYANLADPLDLDVDQLLVVSLNEGNFVEDLEDDYNINTFGDTPNPDIDTNKSNIASFTLGKDAGLEIDDNPTLPNYYLGESLHSTPFVVDYGTADESDDVLFVNTNQGLLHAIDGANGTERWAYLPDRSLASNLGIYFNNLPRTNHQYGLDGEMTFDIRRADDGSVSKADIFMGQRRGGNKYFAIDVTNANRDTNPVAKKWTVSGLQRMAQTWAKPVLANVNYCEDGSCGEREVVFVTGGYDADQYDTLISGQPANLADLADSVDGNAIYMLDRSTGKLLWTAGKNTAQVDTTTGYYTNSDMVHGFPTEPTVIDADFDGIVDFLYAIDIAGNIWRFDFVGNVSEVEDSATGITSLVFDSNDITDGNNGDGSDANNEVSGGIIARLNDNNSNRRFYNRLDISLSPRTENDLARFNLVVGSGMRASPLTVETEKNKLFFVFDRNIARPKLNLDDTGSPIGNGISYNYKNDGTQIEGSDIPERFASFGSAGGEVTATGASNNTTQDIVPLDTSENGINRHGFHILLDGAANDTNGEKMLNPTLTNDNFVLAVSYSPGDVISDISDNVCQKSAGTSILYQINLTTGAAARIALQKSGISAPPVVIEIFDEATDETKKILIIGSESFDASGKPQFDDSPGSKLDKLGKPGLGDTSTGEIRKVNWWERRKR